MTKKLIIFNTIIVSLALMLMLVISLISAYRLNYNLYSDRAKEYLAYVSKTFDGTNFDEASKTMEMINRDVRLTIIDTDGKVIIDTFKNNIDETHTPMGRPELKSENLGKIFKRYSHTLKKNFIYIADIDDNYYIRIAIPLGSITNIVVLYLVISIISVAIIFGISFYAISIFTKKSFQKVNEKIKELEKLGEQNLTIEDVNVDNIGEILMSINESINTKIKQIEKQENELNTVIDSLSQGLIVIDSKRNIKLINKKSYSIFDEHNDYVGKNILYLIRNIEVQSLIDDSFKDKKTLAKKMTLNGLIMNVICYYVNDNWLKEGMIITLDDVTTIENSYQMKKDFFQNASHELKSPLTSIIGFQQMIANGIVDADDAKLYVTKTLKEANRMNNIISDMLNLANIENIKETKNEEVDLRELINDILESLKDRINLKNISVSLDLENTIIKSDYKLLDELIRNVIDNAIKYNVDKGKIDIVLKNKVLKISDTGIGISPEDQKRVFERFYRVDKGRSKNQGGTGLGLAIVKHICELYKYKLILKSILGKGSIIEIDFN